MSMFNDDNMEFELDQIVSNYFEDSANRHAEMVREEIEAEGDDPDFEPSESFFEEFAKDSSGCAYSREPGEWLSPQLMVSMMVSAYRAGQRNPEDQS